METKTKSYYENNIDDIAISKEEFLVKDYNKTRTKSFLHKLGNSLGLVVVVLPVAGLFAAIGGIIMSKGTSEAAYTVGLIFADLGNTVLSNLGLLFMLAILIGFTGNKGMSVYAGIIGYIAFVGFNIAFIRYSGTGTTDGAKLADDASNAGYFDIWFWKHQDVTTQLSNILGLGAAAPSATDIEKHGAFAHASFTGIKALNTGVLGGIALGFIYSWFYNKFKDLKLPSMLAFFEGEKFVAILMIIAAPFISSLFIIVWPGVNWVLGEIGIGFSYLPYGIDSFFYGMFTRWLLPFEAHPAFYGPLWWTNAGGQLSAHQVGIIESMMYRIAHDGAHVGIGQEMTYYTDVIQPWAANEMKIDKALADALAPANGGDFTNQLPAINKIVEGAFGAATTGSISEQIEKTLVDYAKIKWSTSGDQLMTLEILNNDPSVNVWDIWAVNLKVTRFIAGGYSLCMFIIPAIGLSMFATLDKKRRSAKFGLYFGAILSSFLLGVTEPVEFMFAFTAPVIYFAFYAPFYGLAFLLTNLMQVKLGSTFSNGLMDYIVNAIIPSLSRGNAADPNMSGIAAINYGVGQTRLWVPVVIGLGGALIAFPLFRAIFLKFNFAAPGSLAAETGEGVSQSRYSEVKEDYDGLKEYVGGPQNVIEVSRIKPTMLKIKVKYNKYVVNNDFADTKLEDVVKAGNEYTIVAKDEKLGARYLNILNLMVTMRLKDEGFKEAVAQEKIDFKDYLTGKYTIAQYKKDMNQRIKDFNEKDAKARNDIKAQNRKVVSSLVAKRNTQDIKPALDKQKATMNKQLTDLDAKKKTFLDKEKKAEIAFIKKIKASKKKINKAGAKKLRKAQIKNVMVNKKRAEAINRVEAKWQFKQDKLMTTTDLEQLKYNFYINSWNEKHLQDKEILKTEYKFNRMLTKNAEIRRQIKQDYLDMAKGLEYDKEAFAKKQEDYKQQVIAMKAQNKIEFKKQSRE